MSYIDGFAHRQIESAPLANRIERKAFVLAHNIAVFIDKYTAADPFFEIFDFIFQEPVIVVVRNKTDFVGVGLVGYVQQPVIFGKLPDFGFTIASKRKIVRSRCFCSTPHKA
jgi:hypothetical protein